MQILQTSETALFFQFVQSIKHDIQEWQIVELKLTPEGSKLYTIDDIAKKIPQSFADKEGKILICNLHEILIIIRTGFKASTTVVSKKIERALPTHSCMINVDSFLNGLTRIQLNFDTGNLTQSTASTLRNSRITRRILIADTNPKNLRDTSQMLEIYGEVITTKTLQETSKAYVEHAPDIAFINAQLDQTSNESLIDKILGYDPNSHIIIMDNNANTENLLSCMQKGAKNLLILPTNENQITAILKACPAFTDMMLVG